MRASTPGEKVSGGEGIRQVLAVGDIAPSFSAPTTQKKVLSLAELRGNIVILYFFPRAFTPGCTQETRRFRDNYAELRALGAEVIGVSTNDHRTQCKFADDNEVSFPLIADDSCMITADYGVKWPLIPLAKRVTFVIDPRGVIRGVYHHEFQVLRHLDDVFKFVDELRMSEG